MLRVRRNSLKRASPHDEPVEPRVQGAEVDGGRRLDPGRGVRGRGEGDEAVEGCGGGVDEVAHCAEDWVIYWFIVWAGWATCMHGGCMRPVGDGDADVMDGRQRELSIGVLYLILSRVAV